MIIKEDIPKHTQARSDEVTADVDLEDLFFVKVSISFFFFYEGNFFWLIEWLKGNSIYYEDCFGHLREISLIDLPLGHVTLGTFLSFT